MSVDLAHGSSFCGRPIQGARVPGRGSTRGHRRGPRQLDARAAWVCPHSPMSRSSQIYPGTLEISQCGRPGPRRAACRPLVTLWTARSGCSPMGASIRRPERLMADVHIPCSRRPIVHRRATAWSGAASDLRPRVDPWTGWQALADGHGIVMPRRRSSGRADHAPARPPGALGGLVRLDRGLVLACPMSRRGRRTTRRGPGGGPCTRPRRGARSFGLRGTGRASHHSALVLHGLPAFAADLRQVAPHAVDDGQFAAPTRA